MGKINTFLKLIFEKMCAPKNNISREWAASLKDWEAVNYTVIILETACVLKENLRYVLH